MNEHPAFASSEKFQAALRRFDEENANDPNRQVVDGISQPQELIYAQWLTDWVLKLAPDASEALRLAARCQHLCRWMIPRSSFPMTKPGYLQWRHKLKQFHAERAGEILRAVGYSEDVILRVQNLNLKRHFPSDPESRILEDALCLVFLERQLADLLTRSTEEKVINALQKSWAKMSPAGQAAALKLSYAPSARVLLEKALGSAQI